MPLRTEPEVAFFFAYTHILKEPETVLRKKNTRNQNGCGCLFGPFRTVF